MYCIHRTRVIHQEGGTTIYAHVVSDKEGHRKQVYSVGSLSILLENFPEGIIPKDVSVFCICQQILNLLPREEVECPVCHSINVIYGNMHHCNEFYRYVSLGGEDIWQKI